MNIVVCVKQVPASGEQRLDPVTGTVIREGVPSILNPFDAYALEEAVRLKARVPGRVSAISMGVLSAAQTLRRALAVGADDAYLLEGRAFAGADTLATAHALMLGIKKIGGADLILCGRMATDGDTAQVGPMLAEMMGIPHISDVSKVDKIDEHAIEVTRMTDDGYLRVSCPLPALITVVKEINVPRLPSVAGVLRGQDAEVKVFSAEDLGANPENIGMRGSATRLVSTARPQAKAKCRWLSSVREVFEVGGMRK